MVGRLKNIILPFALILALTSCKNFSFLSFVKGNSLASVNGIELYYDDMKSIFTPGMNPTDSINLQNTYINQWIKKQLKIQLAEEKFSANQKDIEKLVKDYRNSLLIYKFEDAYIKENMDTTVTAKEISDYYNANKDQFRLASSLIKAVVVKIPSGFRQEAKMRELARSGSSDKIQDLIDISIKNNLDYKEFTSWTDYAEVVGLVPRLTNNGSKGVQSQVGFYETVDNGYKYFVVVTDVLKDGGAMPMEMTQASIRTVILNKRKQDLLKAMEDKIYETALSDKKITIK